MRVAVVTTSYPKSDADPSGHFVRAEVRALERDGHDVIVLAPRGDAFGWPGIAARVRERPGRAMSLGAGMADLAVRIARAPAVDRVVAHWAVPSAFPMCMALGGELHVVSHGGDVRALLRLPRPLRAAIAFVIARRASAWRFVSERLKASLVDALPRETARAIAKVASVAPSPLDLPANVARRERVDTRPVAVTVARLVRSKRIDRVIAAVAREGTATRLVVVGDGPERRRLSELARARGVDASFVGTVARDEALSWIASADVLFHASEAEGCSTVVREAAALGTPVRWL